MKVEIKIRQDNERGLFACDNIKKGEFVCILPIDYFKLDDKWYVTSQEINRINLRYGIRCEISKTCDSEYDSFLSFYNSKKMNCLNVKKYIEIIGVSNPDTIDDNFVGHMINDYVDMSFLSQNNYEKMSREFANVRVKSKLIRFENRLGLKIIATKNIRKGSELYMSYGSDYWKKYSKKERFVYTIEINNLEI